MSYLSIYMREPRLRHVLAFCWPLKFIGRETWSQARLFTRDTVYEIGCWGMSVHEVIQSFSFLLSYNTSWLQLPPFPLPPGPCLPALPDPLFRKEQTSRGYQPNPTQQDAKSLGTNPLIKASWGNPVGGKGYWEQRSQRYPPLPQLKVPHEYQTM